MLLFSRFAWLLSIILFILYERFKIRFIEEYAMFLPLLFMSISFYIFNNLPRIQRAIHHISVGLVWVTIIAYFLLKIKNSHGLGIDLVFAYGMIYLGNGYIIFMALLLGCILVSKNFQRNINENGNT